jgi:UDP-glucose 4-epimerase
MPAMNAASDAALAAAFAGAPAVITGGLGFIGSNLALRLVALGAAVAIIDAQMPGSGALAFNIAPIRGRVTVERRDIRDTEALAPHLDGARYLFNLAAQTSHLGSVEDPLGDLDTNCRAQLALLELCRRRAPEIAIVFGSTRQFYGKPDYLPVDEAHPLRPPDPNGISKMAGEAYHLLYHRLYGLRTVALRLTNTYGPRMRIKDARQNFLGIWLRRALEGGPIEVWGGEQLRDLTYVDDAVEALLLAAVTPAAAGQAFNLGGERALSLTELARLVVAANGGGEVALKEFPPERKRIDIGDYYADDRRFRAATGWRPAVTIEDGLARSLAYFRAHLPHYLEA